MEKREREKLPYMKAACHPSGLQMDELPLWGTRPIEGEHSGACLVIPEFGRLRQEDHAFILHRNFQASMSCTA